MSRAAAQPLSHVHGILPVRVGQTIQATIQRHGLTIRTLCLPEPNQFIYIAHIAIVCVPSEQCLYLTCS